jgi:ribose/xylose/arabinose/galactoside ABC-type transport system permease subunit
MKKQQGQIDLSSLIIMALVTISFVAWLTHVVTCLGEAMWGFLIAGAIFFPIGVIHGVGIWFGFF